MMMNFSDNPKLNFEPLGSDDSFNLDEALNFKVVQRPLAEQGSEYDEIIELTEQVRIVDCKCPKCSGITEIDLAEMPEAGSVFSCSFCGKLIHVQRESCVCRARRKAYEIHCASCGSQLDHHAHCHSCGIISPDYFVTANPDDVRRKAIAGYFSRTWTAIKSANISLHSVSRNTIPLSEHYHPDFVPHATAPSSLLSRKTLLSLTCLLLLSILIAAGSFAYKSYVAGQVFAQNYFQALYCIKTGVDLNIKTATALVAEWEASSASGRSFSPGIGNKDVIKSEKLRSEIDKYMQKTHKPPARFAKEGENLLKIHRVYLDSENLFSSKPKSLQDFGNSLAAINKNMILVSKVLKSELSGPLKDELEHARLKYRGLKDF